MLLTKSFNITPKQKWQRIIRFLNIKKPSWFRQQYKYKTMRKLTLSGHKNIHGLRYLHKTLLMHFFLKKLRLIPYVALSFNFKKYPVKEFVWCKSLFNQVHPFLHTELTYPGFKLLPLNYILLKNKPFANQYLPLYLISINTIITFLFNNKNQYSTYAKSSGSFATKKKTVKKVKLNYVELPSTKLKLFPIQTFCLLSPAKNLYVHNIIEGGWGTFTVAKKVINVRGVAKNPVDHPNGGRTKAKQPELSPWGWVAKRNK